VLFENNIQGMEFLILSFMCLLFELIINDLFDNYHRISFEENENNYEDEEYEIRNQTDIKEEEIDKLLDQRKSVIAELFQRFN